MNRETPLPPTSPSDLGISLSYWERTSILHTVLWERTNGTGTRTSARVEHQFGLLKLDSFDSTNARSTNRCTGMKSIPSHFSKTRKCLC